MSNWKIGQKLVYTGNGFSNGFRNYGPSNGDIVTFDGNDPTSKGFILLAEYHLILIDGRACFISTNFRPLQGEPAKAELLNSFREVVETADCPINVPQTETS